MEGWGDWTPERWKQEREDFEALCKQADEALADLARAGQEYREHIAKTYHVDPEQVQLFVNERETTITPVIRPNANYPR